MSEPESPTSIEPVLSQVRRQFVDNWGALAHTFGMRYDLSRTHAVVYVSDDPAGAGDAARVLDLPVTECQAHLDELAAWGVIHEVDRGADGGARYRAEEDPWTFFLQLVGERHGREFMPTLQRVRDTFALSRQLEAGTALDRRTARRVQKFSKFIEELSSLLQLFVRIGSKPMAAVLKTLTKFAPRA